MNKKTKKILKIVAASVAAVLLAVCIGIYALFHNEISTLRSLEKVNDYPLYTMDYQGDYGLDAFLEQGGASNDGELVSFVVKRLLKGLPIEINIPSLGCSTFTAKTPDGDYLFGRNFDLDYSPAMLVRTKPDDGYESVSMVNLGFIGYGEEKLPDSLLSSITTLAGPYAPLDGINEKGLSIGVLLIPTEETNQDTDKTDITTTTAIRMILDRCATVEEAVALLKQYDMHSSANSCYHFHIADAQGNSVIVEYIDNEMKLVEPQGAYQAATNFLLTPGDYDFGHGQDRYEILTTELDAKNGVLSEKEAMELLKSASQKPHKTDSGSISSTQWSVVYNNTKRTATISMGRDYEQAFEVSLFDEK